MNYREATGKWLERKAAAARRERARRILANIATMEDRKNKTYWLDPSRQAFLKNISTS